MELIFIQIVAHVFLFKFAISNDILDRHQLEKLIKILMICFHFSNIMSLYHFLDENRLLKVLFCDSEVDPGKTLVLAMHETTLQFEIKHGSNQILIHQICSGKKPLFIWIAFSLLLVENDAYLI